MACPTLATYLLRDPDHHYAVGRDIGAEFVVKAPRSAWAQRSRTLCDPCDPDVAPLGRHLGGGRAQVEQAHGMAAIGQRAREDLKVSAGRAAGRSLALMSAASSAGTGGDTRTACLPSLS